MLFGQRVDLVIIPDNPLPSFILISELGKNSCCTEADLPHNGING